MSIFNTDWFNRDSNYTRVNSDIKLDWNRGREANLSSFLYNGTKLNTLLNSNVELSNELKSLADAIGVNPRVNVYVDPFSETSMTDGKEIIVSNKFDFEMPNGYSRLDLIIGLLCHESAHCLFTDFNAMIKQQRLNNMNQLIHWLHNVIEDELIETKLGSKYPGYVEYIAKVKYFYFDKFAGAIIDKTCKCELDEIMRLFLYVVRYPKYLNTVNSKILNKYDDLFHKIKNILGSNGCLNVKLCQDVTRLSLIAATEIYALLKDYIDKQKEEEEKSNNGKQNGGDGSGNGSSDESETNGEFDTEDNYKSFKDQMNDCSEDIESTLNQSAKVVAKCSASSETVKNTSYGKLMQEKINNASKSITNEIQSTIGVEASDTIGMSDAEITAKTLYHKVVNEVKPQISIAKRIFFNNAYKDVLATQVYRRNGSLDVNKLADAMMGINTIYKQRQNKKVANQTAKYALVLTLDESGSMGIANCHEIVTKLTTIIVEACQNYPEIELYVYGHGDDVIPYVTKTINKKYTIANRRLQGNQSEEISYAMIIDDVKRQTSLPIVAINLTDSNYLSVDCGMLAVMNNYRTRKVSFNLIETSPIDFGKNIRDKQTQKNDLLYGKGNWVKLIDIDNSFNQLVIKFAQIIKRNYEKYK